ncbi:MAG: hypothetical protein WC848_06625 [Parcubacteria group bacterium]|jgi:hypothetical protein
MAEFNGGFLEKSNKINGISEAERAPKGELVNFQELSQKQENFLIDRIEKSEGKIIVFIHPHYSEKESIHTDIGFVSADSLRGMREALPRLLAGQKEGHPPIFIFHDANKVVELEGLLKENLFTDAFVVGTHPDDPTPEQSSWEELLEKLKSVGTKTVILAGMNLVISWPDGNGEPELAGCVMEAAKEFSKEFLVSMSRRVYPNTREDYHRYGGPTGANK